MMTTMYMYREVGGTHAAESCASQQLSFCSQTTRLYSDHPTSGLGIQVHRHMSASFSPIGSVNMRENDGHTHGVSGEAMQFTGMMDIPCIKCDKHGNEEFALTMKDVCYLCNSNFNLFSTTLLLSKGWKLEGDANSIVLIKGRSELRFDIKVETRRGVVFCAYLKRRENDEEVSGIALIKSTMTVERAHGLSGHSHELATRKAAKHLEWVLTPGPMKPCEGCATGKSRQKNVPTVSAGVKATSVNIKAASRNVWTTKGLGHDG